MSCIVSTCPVREVVTPFEAAFRRCSDAVKSTTFYKLQSKVSATAKRVLIELAIALSLNIAILAITATPLSIPILATAAATALVGIIIKLVLEHHFKEKAISLKPITSKITPIAEVTGRLAIVNAVGLSSINIFIHESGHALAAKLCFLKPNIKMHIAPYQGGTTTYSVSNGLTRIGQFLGKQMSILVATAAGIAFSTLFAMAEIGLAFALQHKAPQVSLTLNCHAISQIFNEVIYGLSAFTLPFSSAHDFTTLWYSGGIHPLIPIALMIGLPLAQFAILQVISFLRKSPNV